MKNTVAAAFLLVLHTAISLAQAQAPESIAGQDHIEIPNGSPLDEADGVVVEEFFNYHCEPDN